VTALIERIVELLRNDEGIEAVEVVVVAAVLLAIVIPVIVRYGNAISTKADSLIRLIGN